MTSTEALPPDSGAPPANATERAYSTVLEWIESRQIGAGTVLDERRMSSALNISRTPLRNALNRLLGEGYLTRLANGTIIVREVGVGEVLELLFIRRLLEPEAALLAAGRIPIRRLEQLREAALNPELRRDGQIATWRAGDELHVLVGTYCSNRSLAEILKTARRRIVISSVERVPGRNARATQEHLNILEALIAGDGEKARDAMRLHLENIAEGYLATYGIRSDHAG